MMGYNGVKLPATTIHGGLLGITPQIMVGHEEGLYGLLALDRFEQ